MARNQAQQIVDQASEEATEIRLGAMYYTKDKLAEMRDIFNKIHDMEKENYRTLIESLENDSYIVETNMSEMEANINLLTASSNMSYTDSDTDIDSAFSDNDTVNEETAPKEAVEEYDEDDEDYDEEDDDYDDDFLDE